MNMQAAGRTTVVMEKFDAEGCLDAIARHRVTHGQFVPAMFTRMLKLPEGVRNSYDVSEPGTGDARSRAMSDRDKKQMIDWWGRSWSSTTAPRRRFDAALPGVA